MASTNGTGLHVGIVGAGIGGLLLAQGLRKSGIRFSVFERDPAPEFRQQGYRVTIQATGAAWLEKILSPAQWQAFGRSTREWTGFRMTNEQLETLIAAGGGGRRSIDRMTFRRILLDGVEDSVSFGRTYKSHTESDGGVTVSFDDGGTANVDLLVGADGNQSRVRRQRLPEHAELLDTEQRDLAATLPMNDAARALMRDIGLESILVVSAREGGAMVIIPQQFSAEDTGGNPRDYLYWGLVAHRNQLPAGADNATLLAHAREKTRTWHPLLQKLVSMADPGELALLELKTSVPHGAWQTSRVTLLGDAIHSMTPMRGQGANTAIRDAGELSDRLGAANKNGGALIPAVHDYEKAMLGYGFKAVRSSHNELNLLTTFPPGRRKMIHRAMKTVNAVSRLVGVAPKV
jgi:2-polyprenyl-6-methoxyphenol hydroxylase-like FAD-dependent oxidoreductase